MLRLLILIIFGLLSGCGSISVPSKAKIGIDPTWYPLNFGELQPFVNGYSEDFLIQISKNKGVEFVKMTASWDNLLQGLKDGHYDAILSSLPPYPFNEALFDFSENLLDVGPVFVTKVGEKGEKIGDFQGKIVGAIKGSESAFLLLKDPSIVLRTYQNAAYLLQDLSQGALDAALLEKPFAVSYVNNLYSGVLQIASNSVTNAGIHLITRKGESFGLIELFNSQIKSQNLESLRLKWGL